MKKIILVSMVLLFQGLTISASYALLAPLAPSKDSTKLPPKPILK